MELKMVSLHFHKATTARKFREQGCLPCNLLQLKFSAKTSEQIKQYQLKHGNTGDNNLSILLKCSC